MHSLHLYWEHKEFPPKASWHKSSDITHQQYVAVTWHVSCVSISLHVCGDVTEQQWVEVAWYVFTVGQCRSLSYVSKWQSSEFVAERESSGRSTRTERIGTRRTEDYRGLAYEDLTCELRLYVCYSAVGLGVCNLVRVCFNCGTRRGPVCV
jgi:hypothetical protein